MRFLRSEFTRSEDGSALVEMALLLPVLLLIVLGVFDYALVIEKRLRLAEAVAAGTAYAALPGNALDIAGTQNAATLAAVNMPEMSVTASAYWTCTPGGGQVTANSTCSGGIAPMQWMEVDATATPTLKFQFPGLPFNVPLTAASIHRVVR